MTISFIFPKDADKERVNSKSDNIKFTLYNNANEVVDELFQNINTI